MTATANSQGRSARTLRIPLASTSSSPMRKTMQDNTASGMYDSGLVRYSSTISTTTAVVSCDIWLRPPASSTISVLVGEPLTGNVVAAFGDGAVHQVEGVLE